MSWNESKNNLNWINLLITYPKICTELGESGQWQSSEELRWSCQDVVVWAACMCAMQHICLIFDSWKSWIFCDSCGWMHGFFKCSVHIHMHTHKKNISWIVLVSIFGEAETSESKTRDMLNSQILTGLTNTWRKATTGSSPKQMWVTRLKQLSCSHSEITHVVYPVIQLG